MEAVRVRKPKLKTDEIISRLESIIVPDDALPVEDEVFTSPQLTVSEPQILSRCEDNTVPSTFHSNEGSAPKDLNRLYPPLDGHFATDVEGNQSADHEAESVVEDIQQSKVEASAPDLFMNSSVEGDLLFDSFPPSLSSEHLRNLYINRSLDLLNETENSFLKNSEFELLTVPNSSGFNIPDDPFYLLLCKYADNWGKWLQALKRLSKVLKESSGMEMSAWKVMKHTNSVDSKCQDKRTVCLKYEYEKATLIQSVLSELKETSEVSHWIIFEEIPLIAYKLVQCRNRIEEYLANILTQCSIYENLTSSQPGILIGSKVDSTHLVQLNEMRSTCSILFACLRQFWSNQYAGRTHDPTFLKHLSNWLILTAGVTVRACRPEDHIFILMQLLRLPSQLIKLFTCLLQPPDPIIAWERTKNLVEFLNQPEVELILTLFAICLRPVRERARFVTPVNIGSCKEQINSSVSQNDTIWTTVDSAGESDIEEPEGSEVNKKNKSSISTQYDISSLLSDYDPNLESCTYLNPKDLNCLLGQLRIERVLQLLAYDYIPNCENVQYFSVNESGFMTSIAFADRLLSLIEACEKIYSDYVLPPGPQTHLGSWRSLAKRLARLIRLLLISIGFRIQTIVYQQQYHHVQNSQQFTLILSQYDSLCIRAVNCLLLSGSGLPDAYQKAGQLTCWRNLACTLPLGLTMVKTKKELFYIILKSILQNNDKHNTHNNINKDSVYTLMKECIMNNTDDLENVLPNMILSKLHRVLLLMGFNELGLSVVINVLGKLASLECRPRMIYNNNMPTTESVNTSYRYELPGDEVSLIKCIMRIIFGLSVYHRPNDLINRKDNQINIKHSTSSSDTSDSSISIFSLLPISPKYGCKQLIEISNKHPQICLHLLFDLIIESALDLTTNPLLTIKLHDRISQLNLYFSDQYMRVEDILLQLVIEAPFHIMQPNNKEVEFLIDSLCHYSANCFLHKLCRLFLSRFSWDAFKDLQSQEPFIPLRLHLDMALGLCEIVDKQISDLSHFHLTKLINPKLVSEMNKLINCLYFITYLSVSNMYKSAKSSVNVLTATLTDQFLSSLLISQQRLRIKSSGLDKLTHVASELSRRTHSVENITVSSSSSSSFLSNPDQSLYTIKDIIDWAAELLLRLIIPGSKYGQNYLIGTDSSKLKEYVDQIWLKLDALVRKNKYDQKKSTTSSLLNPIISFVMLSLQTIYSTMNKDDNCVLPTSSTTKDCNFWQPQSPMLNQLLKSIFIYKHFKLTLRTLFIVCKCIPSLYSNENNQPIVTNLSWPELKELFHDLFDCSSAATASLLLSSDSDEQQRQQHLQQFLNRLYQFPQNPISSFSLTSSSSKTMPTDSTLFFPYLLIGMFIELTNSIPYSYSLNNIIIIIINMLLDSIDCFNQLSIILLLDLLIQLEYWNRLKCFLPTGQLNPSGLDNYKLKLRMINTSVYENFQFKFKEIRELHTQNKSTESLHNIVATSLETAYSWAWSQTSFIITSVKSNLISSSSSSYRKDNTVNANCYSEQNKFKNIIQYECIFNKINFRIIQTYLKYSNNDCQLTPPYWLLAWLQSIIHNEETMKSDTIEDTTNYQYLNYWKYITPFISLYQDELISAGNQLVNNHFQSSSRNDINTSSLATPVKQILQKILFESGLVQLISSNLEFHKNNNYNNPHKDELFSNQVSSLTDATIAWIFSQFSLVQGVYLIHLCPVNHPICPLLIHNVLCQLFNLISPSSVVDADQHLSTRHDQTNSTDYNLNGIKSRCSNNSFTPGFLLLRCLPASLFIHTEHSSYLPLSSSSPSSLSSSPSSSSPLNKQDYQQSLFQLIIQKIRLYSSTNSHCHSNKPSFTHDFNCLIDFLCQSDVLLSRSPFLNVNDIKSNSKLSHLLDPGYQRSVIDILLCYFDWVSLNSFMQTSQSLWNTYQYIHKSNMKVSNENENVNVLSTVSPESSVLRLQNSESHERRIELSCSSSFEVLFSSSSLMTLPSSIDEFPKYMKDTVDSLRQHAKQMCNRIECIEKLQNEFCTNILPKLYIPVRVSLLQYVECQSILPSWMPGHQPCSGGTNISCEYQTDERNKEIDELYQMNRSDTDKLIKLALDVSRTAACDVLNYNDSSPPSTSTSSEGSNFGVNWARTVLQLENAVSYLIHKSRLITSESKSLNTNVTHVSSESSSSSSLYPSYASTTTTNTSINNQLNAVQNIGLECFQQLCQNLSGPLLQCPLTKQVLSKCVGELASEFLTNLSTQHQLLLDMLVALPHLSNLLSSTFIPPNPSSLSSLYQSQQHPLLPIYQRLMDIRFRCNAQTALCILEKINFKAWFSIEIKHFSQKQWSQLMLALFTCIEETTNVYSSDINSTCSEENDDLHKLCIVHLKALLTNHFPDMFVLAFELLLQNLSNPKYLDIWILFQDLLIADISTNSGSTTLSIEQLTQLLNHVHRRLTSAVNSSPVTSLSPLRDTQNVLIDECCSMLQNNSSQTIQTIIHFLMILACQLCEKIGCCILRDHLSIQNGQSIVIDMLIQVFGCILQKCITLYYNGKANNTTESSTTSSSSTTIQTSYQSSSSFIVYAKCCLKGFSECLNSAIKVCPTDGNPIWSNQLINLFLIWFTSTTCISSNFGDNLNMVPVTSTSSTTTTNLCKQNIHKISLPLLIYSSINEKEKQDDDSGDFNQNNDEKKEFILSKWCLSLTSYIWKPNLDCLDSMIMVTLCI
uniref:Ectopic P granules protein 5 n=2 Tax=Schistosoma mansoni TaxID=6183 RepID=A0A5K4F0Z2_SCHMA